MEKVTKKYLNVFVFIFQGSLVKVRNIARRKTISCSLSGKSGTKSRLRKLENFLPLAELGPGT